MSGRGAERILQVVEWMAEQSQPVAFAEVVHALELPKSSTLDLLRILVDAGYVSRLENGRYQLLRLPGEPTIEGRGWGTLLRHAEDALRNAVEQTGESGFIAVLGKDYGVRYILKILPQREIRYDRDVTVARRPHQVSSGIILLGRLTRDELRTYCAVERAAGRYEGTDEALSETVAAAERRGFQLTRIGVVEGAGGMASPIFDRDGRVIAALNIAGPAQRLADAVDRIEPVLRETAELISRSLGWGGNPVEDVARRATQDHDNHNET